MNVRCPACSRLYRIADERVATGATLRCTGCGHQFSGGGASVTPGEVQPFAERRRPRATKRDEGMSGGSAGLKFAVGPSSSGAPASKHGPEPMPAAAAALAADPDRVAVLADAGRPCRATLKPVLERLGFKVVTVEDGTEAFRLTVARRPALVIASVHLAGLSGVAICEGVKQSPHLKSIAVVLIGAQDTADLFNHDTALGYGADLFLDEAMRAEEMKDRLEGIVGAGTADEPADDADEFAPALEDLNQATRVGAPREEIRRLARIMMSDLRLYNPERFRQALDEGRLLEVFKVELARGRDIIDQRFPDLATRQDQLAAAIHDSIEQERLAAMRG